MKQIKRLISALLVFCLVISAIPLTAHAAESGTCGKNLTWTLSSQGVLTISGSGPMENYGYYVAPWYDANVQTVVIQSGVTTIGESAFEDCDELTEVKIPDTVTSIGNYAFSSCEKLSSVTIPASVTTIGNCAFMSCSDLSTVTIPGSVAAMGESVFYGCSGLNSVTICPGVTVIGDGAFEDCDNLTSAAIPDSVTQIGECAFADCDSLTGIMIPSGVTTLSDGAFMLSGLTSVNIPGSVSDIGACAFAWCSNLTEIHFGGKSPEIAYDAFSGVTATAYYPAGEASWTAGEMLDYEGNITWKHSGDHIYDAVRTEPTCTESGTIVYTCFCGHTYWEFIDPLAHDCTAVVTDPTCTAWGYTTYTCKMCGYSHQDDYTGITDHSYGKWQVTKAAACTEDGVETRTCGGCGNKQTQTIEKTGHRYGEWIVTKEATCTQDGVKTSTCGNCGNKQTQTIEKTGHRYGEWIVTKEATCTQNGVESSICGNCGAAKTQTIEKTGHRYGEWIVTKEATCTQNGVESSICGNCGAVKTQTIAAIGHSYGAWKVTKAATCTDDGVETSSCGNCGNKKTQTIAAIGHSYGAWKVTKAATCTNDGVETSTCGNCGDQQNRIIQAIGHDYTGKVTAPTCTENGYTIYTCKLCGHSYAADEVAALDHAPAEAVKENEAAASCQAAGGYDLVVYCSVCGDEINREHTEVPAIGHSYENGVCSVCGETDIRVEAPVVKASNKASSGKIVLKWEKVDGAAKYQVYRATSKSGTYKLMKTASSTTYTNTTAKAGIQYYYYVVAVTKDGEKSEPSKIVSRTCDLAQPEVKVSNVASSGKVRLTWTKIDGAKEYKVYRAASKNGKYKLMKTTKGTSYTNTTAKAGETYYYKVVAVHTKTAVNSAYSAVKSRTCDLAQPVVSVSRNKAGKPVVSWNSVSGAAKYTLSIYNSKGGLIKTTSTTKTKLTHSLAVKGTSYTYKVTAVHSNTAANSAKSSGISMKSK